MHISAEQLPHLADSETEQRRSNQKASRLQYLAL